MSNETRNSAGNSNAPQRPPGAVAVRRLEAHEWAAYRQLRLRSLAEAPYAFGSTLAAEEAWRPEIWMARLTAAAMSGRDCPLVAECEAAPGRAMLGLVYAKCDAEEAGIVNLFQMWVAPEARGRGVAAALLDSAIGWARAIGAHAIRLGVIEGNAGAARLYARAGFRDLGRAAPMRPDSTVLEQTMQLDLAATAGDGPGGAA